MNVLFICNQNQNRSKTEEQIFKDKEFKARLDSLHTTPGTPVQEFEGVHVDIWYDDLEHLAGQHVWI